ncbi:MAG: DUF2111 domain-containing protein [archaeon]|nr:DUF2111 domain-containing protein [archaeon]
MALNDSRPRMGGPIPKFNEYHIWKTLYCLNRESPIGRKKLATLLDIGEGSTRTILSLLQENGNILIRKNGVSLTPEGKKIWNGVAMNVSPISVETLTIGNINCAVQVPQAANKVKFGCEERDHAIMSGATGATTLIYSNGTIMFPGNDYPLDSKSDKAIKSTFKLSEGDVIIIGTAESLAAAEEGAVTAGLKLLGGLRTTHEEVPQESSLSSINELLAMSFMIHDLVGGLPVCAKSKDDLGIRIENGAVVDNAYTGAVLEEVLKVGTTIRRIATSGPYKGIRVIVTPLEVNNKVVAAIGVVDIRTMAGVSNLIRLHEDDDL